MYEDQRLALQATLDAQKTQAARNAMGQFATPTLLARAVVEYAASLLPSSDPVRFIDPAIGTGSFFSALLNVVDEQRIDSAVGFEIDAHYGQPAQELWGQTSLRIYADDFTKAVPPSADSERFNLLVCNPPYVRHHHIAAVDKARLQDSAAQAAGIRVGGLAGLYCYFLALAHAWMKDGGIAAWLIPSEFMDVNYGRAVKQYLLTKVRLLRIHRFDPNAVQFEDALVSSAVVFFRKESPQKGSKVEFTFGGTIREPGLSRIVSTDDLAQESKWTRFPIADIRTKHLGVTLGDLFRIKRGLATGDNKFFILTRPQIEEKQLPWEFFTPILPSPRHLRSDRIRADSNGNPLLDRQLFLLDCRRSETEVRERYPRLWAYLQTGQNDVARRYLCQHRTPWYSQEDRPAAPFVCTYLGRSDKKDAKPFRFLLNESRATAANVYLLLYPKEALAARLARDITLAERLWEFLGRIDASSLLGEGRVYGGGLHKLEPKELANVPADDVLELAGIPALDQQSDLFGERAA